MKRLNIVLFLTLIYAGCFAQTKTLIIDSIKINFPIPDGYEFLNKKNPNDRRFIEYLEQASKNTNTFILAFANTEVLKKWRLGKVLYLNDHGVVYLPKSTSKMKIEITPLAYVKALKKIYLKQGVQLADRAVLTSKSIMKELIPELRANDIHHLGILSHDDKGLYLGMLQSFSVVEPKYSDTIVSVWATSLIRKKSLNFYLYKSYKNNQDLVNLENSNKKWIKQIHQAN